MKKQILTVALLLGMLMAARATLYVQGTTGQSGVNEGSVANSIIYDGNPASVTANSMDLTSAGLGSSLSLLTVTVNITGGRNNGLYGYLVAPNGTTTVILMNQPGYIANGFGAMGAGMNITLQDGTSDHGSIQSETSGSVLSGSYNSANNLSGFNGVNPDGTWTLYFADTLAGGGNATLNGWSLAITAVPEPVNVALAIFGVALAVGGCVRRSGRTDKCASI
jgi:subtilisin-like proprotein convertase family protein